MLKFVSYFISFRDIRSEGGNWAVVHQCRSKMREPIPQIATCLTARCLIKDTNKLTLLEYRFYAVFSNLISLPPSYI